ncbi:MAG: hypothetical protein QXS81_05545 [Candidatus Micrarchaeaceae archaeon]
MLQYIMLAISLIVLAIASIGASKKRYIATLLVAIAYALFLLFLANFWQLLVDSLAIAFVAQSFFYHYGKKDFMFLISSAFILAGMCYWLALSLPMALLVQLVGGCMLISLVPNVIDTHERESKAIEVRRDAVQILLGITVMSILFLLPIDLASAMVLILIMIAGTLNSYLVNSSCGIAKALKSLERNNITFGIGAVYIAISTLLLIGFVHSLAYLLFGIASLFIADSVATIIGINGRHKILHKKSVEGSLAYFAALAGIGYFLIGINALPLSLLLMAIEALSSRIDDNLLVPIVFIAVYRLIIA